MRGSWVLGLAVVDIASAGEVRFQHQARLLDAAGAPIAGSHAVTATLYDVGGASVWARTFSSVPFEAGYFTLVLDVDGTGRTIDGVTDAASPPVEIGVAVDGGAELVRLPFSATPLAARARVAEGVQTVSAALGASCASHRAGELAWDPASEALLLCNDGAWRTLYAGAAPGSLQNPGTSCKQINTDYPETTTGAFYIKPATWSGSPFRVWCDMDTDGGGWTLVGKVSGLVHSQDGGVLDSSDTRWLTKSYLGAIDDLSVSNALGPSYESVSFTDFMLMGLNDTNRKVAWRHPSPFSSLHAVFSASTQHRTTQLLVGDFRSMDYRSGCSQASGPTATGPQFYGFNINGDSYVTNGSLVNGYTGGWCAALAGWGRDNQSEGYTGGGLGANCQGRTHQIGRHYWGWGDGCNATDWGGTPGTYQTFYGHAFFVR
jgi:hypothetical protein